jgi:hypothetical protein
MPWEGGLPKTGAGVLKKEEEMMKQTGNEDDPIVVADHPHSDRRNWQPDDDSDEAAVGPPVLSKETLDAILADPEFTLFCLGCRIVVLARRKGASVEAIGKFCGESRTSMYRWFWLYEQVGTASLSQMGRDSDEKTSSINAAPS